MENILEAISIVVFCFYVGFAVRYYKKDTLLSLIGFSATATGISVLDLVTIIIRFNIDKSYEPDFSVFCIYTIISVYSLILIISKINRNKLIKKRNISTQDDR